MPKIAQYMVQSFHDDNLKVPMGVYPGVSAVNKFGENPTLASGATEDIWDGSALYVFPATALMTKLSQTTNQVAMKGETVQIEGLDANFVAVSQSVTLNASNTTTPVVLATPLIRVNRMYVTSAIVTDQAIRLHNDAESQDYSVILAGNNQTLQAIYTVPAGKKAFMTGLFAVINPGGGNPTSCDIKVWNTDNANSYAKQLKFVLGIDLDFASYIQHQFKPYKEFPAKSDIYMSATTVAAGASVSAGFDLILVDV
jgi:hypothetical protein